MIEQHPNSTRKDLLTVLILRGIALGGRFVFAIFAAKYMLPQGFGQFGLLAALALVIPTVVGLESNQVLLRRILQEPSRAPETRRFYGIFTLTGSLISGALGALTLVAFGWSASEVGLGAAILVLEHIGLETFRNLINERRPVLSVLSVALRTGAWGVLIPTLYFAGLVTAPWTFETVLWFWTIGSTAAVLVGIPLWGQFRPRRDDLDLRRGLTLLKDVVSRSWMWVVFNASWKVIETGGRFVCAWMISDAAAGRFTFVSMLASLNYVALKGVVEPIYYPRLSALDATEGTFREFRRATLVVVLGGILCSVIGLAASARLNATIPPPSELLAFAFLCLAFAFLSISQTAHFRLYRQHQDKTIMLTGVLGCAVMAISCVVGTWLWGVTGAAAGTMVGALVLLAAKNHAARELRLGQTRKPCIATD